MLSKLFLSRLHFHLSVVENATTEKEAIDILVNTLSKTQEELDSYSAGAESNFSEVNQISVALLISTELSLGGSNGAQNFYST